MEATVELEQSHRQARKCLVSLVWQLSQKDPDFDTAFDKADKLCSALGLCRIIEAGIERRKASVIATNLQNLTRGES